MVLGLAFGIYSCSKKQASTEISKKEYSGEELFRGIFFLEGEVAGRIPSYQLVLQNKEVKENLEHQESINFKTEITQILLQENSTLFSNLQASIYLKDRYAITQNIKEINMHIKNIMESNTSLLGKNIDFTSNDITKLKKDGSVLENSDMSRLNNRCGFAVFCVAYAGFAVHNAAVVTTFTLAAVGAVVWGGVYLWEATYSRDFDVQNSSFKLESFVDEIVIAIHQ